MSTVSTFAVRSAHIADAPQILAIFLQLEAQLVFKTGIDLAAVSEWIDAATEQHPFWVLEDADQLIGWCALEPFYGLPALAGTLEIAMYIDVSHHGRGAGRYLLNHVLARQSELGLHSLVAYMLANNVASQRFFMANGFEKWGCLPNVARSKGQVSDLLMLGRQLVPSNGLKH